MAGFFIAPNYSSVQPFTFSIPSIPTNTAIQTINAQNQESQQEIQRLTNELEKIQAEAKSLQEQQQIIQNNAKLSVQEKNQALQKIQNEMKQLGEQYKANKAELEQKYRLPLGISHQRIIKLEEELNKVKQEKENIQQEKEKVNQNLAGLKSRLEEKEQQYNKNQTTITQLRTNLSQARQNAQAKNNLEEQLNNALRQQHQITEEVRILKTQLAKEQQAKQEVDEQAKQTQTTSNAIKTELKQLQTKVEEQKTQLEQAESARKTQEALINTWRNTLGVGTGATSQTIIDAIQTLRTNKNGVQKELQQLQTNLRSSLSPEEGQSIKNALTKKLEELNQLRKAQSNLNRLKNAIKKQYEIKNENNSINKILEYLDEAKRKKMEEEKKAKISECREQIKHGQERIERKINIINNINQKIKNDIAKQFPEYISILNQINNDYEGVLSTLRTNNENLGNNCQNNPQIGETLNQSLDELDTEWNKILANINEDVAGSVRVYVRVKPYTGDGQSVVMSPSLGNNTVQKNIIIRTCLDSTKYSSPKDYGEFYGVFPQSFNNRSIFRGKQIKQNKNRINLPNVTNLTDQGAGIYRIFQQLQSGYNAVLFGYGLSGSGKTYTLFGDNKTSGIVKLGLKNLKNLESIEIKDVFEQYVKDVHIGTSAGRFTFMKGQLIVHTGNDTYNRLRNMIGGKKQTERGKISTTSNQTFGNDEVLFMDNRMSINPIYSNDQFQDQNFTNFLNTIERNRKEKERIKATPNNPNSSRSHLYIRFKITFTDGTISYLTVVDMAGKESPEGIYKTFKKKTSENETSIKNQTSRPSNYNKEIWEEMIKKINIAESFKQSKDLQNYLGSNITKESTNKRKTYEYPYQVIKEGIYINETLNHLKWYFKKKNGQEKQNIKTSQSAENYNPDNYIVSPVKEEEHKYELSKIGNNITFDSLMVPILEYLDKGLTQGNKTQGKKTQGNKTQVNQTQGEKTQGNQKESKPTKFVMICNVRQEMDYCDQTRETLDFAELIKST